MLVLATIILLLLVATDAKLTKATAQLAASGDPIVDPPSKPVEQDPDAPVKGPLVRGGRGESGDTPLGEETSPPRGSTSGPNSSPDAGSGESEPEPTPIATPAPNEPDSPHEPIPPPEDPTGESVPPVEPPEASGSPVTTPAVPTPDNDSEEGVLVGFDPCWRRHSSGGRQYYYVYDVTFERESSGGRFRIVPHSDWQKDIPIVNEALVGSLSLLKDYPKHAMTADEFRAFGRRIESALKKKREERPDDDYKENCLLAVTLDGDAPGRAAKFVRVDVGLYPITR